MRPLTATSDQRQALDAFIARTAAQAGRFLGFQTSQAGAAIHDDLTPLLQCNLLNIGDAYTGGHFRVHAKDIEREVLATYARLWHAPNLSAPNTVSSYWGYLTTMGSTEGNYFGLWHGRDYLRGDPSFFDDSPINAVPRCEHEPVLITSRDVHYSVAKAAHVLALRLPSQTAVRDEAGQPAPDFMPVDDAGAMDVDVAVAWAERLHAHGHPILFACTVGTTFRGGSDDITTLIARLPQLFTDQRKRYAWIHVDGAISANLLPWLEQAHAHDDAALRDVTIPAFDFRLPAVSSICCSPYKWMGAPFPFGLYLTHGKYRLRPPTHPRYIGCADSTLSGSRSGLACVLAWHYLHSRSDAEHQQDVLHQFSVVDYAYGRLSDIAPCLRTDTGPFRVFPPEPASPIICFSRPPQAVVERFSLACEDDLTHIVILNHVDRALIDDLIDSLVTHCQNT